MMMPTRNVSSFPWQRQLTVWTLASGLALLLSSGGSGAAQAMQERSSAGPIVLDEGDWPWWRGPNRDGIAPADQTPPLDWSATKNILWSSPLPGEGHGSPTVVGDRIFLAAADYDSKVQSVLCYDRTSGRLLWKTDIHKGGFPEGGHKKNNLAAASVASDGRRVYINFLNGGSVYTTALGINGERLWQAKVSDFDLHQGFGSSPAVYESLVIAASDNRGGGAVVAFDRSDGKVIWRQERPKLPNYTSPILLHSAGRDQLVLTGCDLVSSLDPLSGKKLWEVGGSTTEVVTSAVTDGKLVFISGGYPRRHVAAVRADGSGEIAWEQNVSVYVPSMLVRDGHLFLVTDSGIARCWIAATGEEVWRGRLEGTFSASPVLVDNLIYATNEVGQTFIFEANPREFKLVAENKLGDHVMATPSICGSRIYMRVGHDIEGRRRESLYCIANGAPSN